jgi:hypothetical protein
MSEESLFTEKRLHPRIPLNIPVTYRVIDDPNKNRTGLEPKELEQTSHTLDVSFSGLLLATEKLFTNGSILRLDMTLPGIFPNLLFYARVVWSSEAGAGLHFEVMKKEDETILKNFLSQIPRRKTMN